MSWIHVRRVEQRVVFMRRKNWIHFHATISHNMPHNGITSLLLRIQYGYTCLFIVLPKIGKSDAIYLSDPHLVRQMNETWPTICFSVLTFEHQRTIG